MPRKKKIPVEPAATPETLDQLKNRLDLKTAAELEPLPSAELPPEDCELIVPGTNPDRHRPTKRRNGEERPNFTEQVAASRPSPSPIPDEALPPFPEDHVKHARITTARPFVGRVASGRGRVVTADDSSYCIEANPPLTSTEHALAVRNGFDDESPDGSLLIADKKAMRDANGDINHVAYALTSKSMEPGPGR